MTGLRIIAGKHKGRALMLGKAAQVRPTSGFARQALFNILSHGAFSEDSPYIGKPVADVFCGTGAFGLEALSRGAQRVTFVDADPHALQTARANAEALGEGPQASFVRADGPQVPPAAGPYALLFLDPPYFSGLLTPTLLRLRAQGWLDDASLIVLEQDARETPVCPPGFTETDTRRYGRAMIRFLRLGGA
jgi:16S rRNA (guanine966-N2)-methyltransferase